MIIQNTTHVNPAVQPDGRAAGGTPVNAAALARPASINPAPINNTPAQDTPLHPTAEELQNAVAVINTVMQLSNHSLEFSVDHDAGRIVVKMVDTSTGELIRQYPSEATLAISRGIERFQHGLLLTQKA